MNLTKSNENNPSIKLSQQKGKDEIDVATDWERPYLQLYTRLRWLNAFSRINYIAIQRQIIKYMKTFYKHQDNIIDKKLIKFLNEQSFTSRKNVKPILEDLKTQYAIQFTNGDIQKADAILNKKKYHMRLKDAAKLSAFGGAIVIIAINFILACALPFNDDPQPQINQIIATLPAFRFAFMLSLYVGLIGTIVMVLRKYRVNYVFIFELDPTYKITHVQIYRIFMVLLSITAFFFSLQLAIIKLNGIIQYNVGAPAIMLFICLLAFILCPFHIFYLRARIELFKILYQIIILPFGKVKFRHFFLAIFMTSFVQSFKDIGTAYCYFFGQYYDQKLGVYEYYWRTSTIVKSINHMPLYIFIFAVSVIPLYFRLCQSIIRYRETHVLLHKLNAMKYVLAHIAMATNIYQQLNMQSQTALIVFVLTQSVYVGTNICWEIYFDWGLMRIHDGQRAFMRPKTMLPRWVYPFAAVTNFFMRQMWIATLIARYYPQSFYYYTQTYLATYAIVEALRRTQWAIIRIENENVNNFEKYRNILQIPEFEDELPGLADKKKVK